MGQTYKATGINLKSIPLGEADRLLTILTPEYGVIRAVAPGARKSRSKLGARANLFVVNELLLSRGRSLDKINQAETIVAFTGLSKQLACLTASQYLAELVLSQAGSEHTHAELFTLLCQTLTQLEQDSATEILNTLTQAVYHLLNWGGIAPQVFRCCLSQTPIQVNLADPDWRVGFSFTAGGVVSLTASSPPQPQSTPAKPNPVPKTAESSRPYSSRDTDNHDPFRKSLPALKLTAVELALLQDLANQAPPVVEENATIIKPVAVNPYPSCVWLAVERTLRQYAQYHLDRPIRSAALMDVCFSPLPAISAPS
jgi:DNA repair protein RecO (recombination protein O)